MNKINQLNKVYSNRFKQLNKCILTSNDSGLSIFVEHLKYLRDVKIITQESVNTVATLNAAIEEFEAFKKTQKDFHWNNFCEFIKVNMKEWLVANDSV